LLPSLHDPFDDPLKLKLSLDRGSDGG